jgi:hypothetical protein
MPATHGKLTKVYINAYDLTGLYRKASIEATREVADATGFNQAEKSYVAGLGDATLSLEGMFDSAVNSIDAVLDEALSADPTIIAVCPQGDTLGNVAYGVSSAQTKYSIDTSKDAVASLAHEVQSTVGADRLLVHHIIATEVASGQASSIDNGAATSNGGVGYLEVFAISGISSLSVVVEDSADNSSFATILTFSAVTTSRVAQRVAITGTVRRYTRCRWTFTGTGSAQFWVGFGRN